jgi:two-component system phosphate regulon sensor histidine kinase PhoR
MITNTSQQIFIVSPDPQIRYLLQRILAPAGYTVSGAENKEKAEQMLTKFSPAAIVISEKLSDGDGLDLARSVLEHFPALPVLLFVNHDTPELLKSALRLGVSDYLCLPLRADDVIKAIENSVQNAKRRKKWALMEAKRATAYLQHQVSELETMSRLGRSITASLDLDSVLAAVVDAAVELTGAEEGSLLLVDEMTGELYMRAARNFQEEFVRTFRVPVKNSLAGSVILTGKAVLLDEKTPQKIKTAYLVQGLIYVPLQIHGLIFGVLGVDNRKGHVPFNQHHVQLISTLAEYAVIAIENARLYSNTSVERNKLETILTRIQDGVIVIDNNKNILLMNQTVRAAFTQGTGNPIGKPISEVVMHPDMLDWINTSQKNLSNRAEITIDDGRVFNCQVTPIPDVGMAVTMQDITHLKKLDRIKTDFVNTVSHDLRSPLTAILGYVELIERVGPINQRQRDFITRVDISVHNITTLVDDLLNLGRIESGFDSRRETIQIAPVIQYAMGLFTLQATERGIEMVVDLPEQFPPIFGNPVHIRQMIEKLYDNAFKYTGSNGKISTSGRLEGEQLILQISDTGKGVPPSDLPFIFDKFFRPSNLTPEVVGTGLGLAIVKSIIENHGGRIWVDSTIGKGTTFTIVLPAAKP